MTLVDVVFTLDESPVAWNHHTMREIKHGTTSTYQRHKCRCDLCKEAHRLSNLRYRQDNPEKVQAHRRKEYADNREKVLEQQREYRARNIDRIRQYDRDRGEQRREYITERSKVAYQLNREKYIARAKKWKADNPERSKELAADGYQRRLAENPEKVREENRAAARRAREADPEKFRERFRQWARSPEGRVYFRANRDARRGAPYTEEALEWMKSLVDPLCTYCGAPANSIDHIVPVSKGGTGELDNLTPACMPCNNKKRSMSLAAFLERKDR